MSVQETVNDLFMTRRRIAKRRYGSSKNDWPPYILARYEDLKQQASALREALGETV